MNAPAGGESGGITAIAGSSRGEESSSEERNTCTTLNWAGPDRLGATMTAGSGALALQQSVWAVWLDSDAGAQQSCAVLWACCWQIPFGARSDPISTMVTAARWKIPLRMRGFYQIRCVLW